MAEKRIADRSLFEEIKVSCVGNLHEQRHYYRQNVRWDDGERKNCAFDTSSQNWTVWFCRGQKFQAANTTTVCGGAFEQCTALLSIDWTMWIQATPNKWPTFTTQTLNESIDSAHAHAAYGLDFHRYNRFRLIELSIYSHSLWARTLVSTFPRFFTRTRCTSIAHCVSLTDQVSSACENLKPPRTKITTKTTTTI